MSSGLRTGLQVLLGIIIVVLGYWLYLSITEPWAVVEQERVLTEQTRDRMDNVRNVLIRHQRANQRFPSSLDSLMIWVRQDSVMQANSDSLFAGVNLDSITYSPRSGTRFHYVLNDTGRVAVYLLKDPDSDDQIGTEAPDVTLLNAASWE